MNLIEEFAKKTTGETKEVFDNLVHSLVDAIKQRNDFQKKIEILIHENRLLKKHIYGSKSEKIKDTELLTQKDILLFNELELVAQEVHQEESVPPIEDTAAQNTPKPRKPPGRKPLPSHL